MITAFSHWHKQQKEKEHVKKLIHQIKEKIQKRCDENLINLRWKEANIYLIENEMNDLQKIYKTQPQRFWFFQTDYNENVLMQNIPLPFTFCILHNKKNMRVGTVMDFDEIYIYIYIYTYM